MAIIAFRSPVTVPLLSADEPSPPAGIFQVTQHFNTPDYYASQRIPPPNPLPTHGAVDIGDKRCGAPIVAMAPGTAYRVQDNATSLGAATNALGVVVDHGFGVRSAYWHLATQTVGNGQPVVAGQQIGTLGNTGLLAICHCHIEILLNGVKIDPEPHMFGAALDTELPSEDDVRLPDGTAAMARGVIGAGVGIRTTAVVADDNLIRRTEGDTFIDILFPLNGQGPYNDPVTGQQRRDWVQIVYGTETACVARAYVGDIFTTDAGKTVLPLPVAGGFTQAQIDAARNEGRSIGFSQGKTKAIAAVEAIEP